jgi:hypothetical protein
LEDKCHELNPERLHFFPEAFEEEEWEHCLNESKISPNELRLIAIEVSAVRDEILKRTKQIEMESNV